MFLQYRSSNAQWKSLWRSRARSRSLGQGCIDHRKLPGRSTTISSKSLWCLNGSRKVIFEVIHSYTWYFRLLRFLIYFIRFNNAIYDVFLCVFVCYHFAKIGNSKCALSCLSPGYVFASLLLRYCLHIWRGNKTHTIRWCYNIFNCDWGSRFAKLNYRLWLQHFGHIVEPFDR